MKPHTCLMVLLPAFLLGACHIPASFPTADTTIPAISASPAQSPAALAPPIKYAGTRVRWGAILSLQPAEWYASEDALGLAVNVIGFQTDSGGWPKNLDMTIPPDKIERGTDPGYYLSNIDNNATETQVNFLAKIH